VSGQRPRGWAAAFAAALVAVLPGCASSRPDRSALAPLCWSRATPAPSLERNAAGGRQDARWQGDGCEVRVRLNGVVRLSADAARVEHVAPGASLSIEERTAAGRRLLSVEPGEGGAPRLEWKGPGQPDGAALATWLDGALPQLAAHTGLFADERGRALAAAGGPDAVLEELSRTPSASARRAYLERLLERPALAPAQLVRVAAAAGETLESGDLARVLHLVLARAEGDTTVHAAVSRGAASISSPGDRALLLSAVAAAPRAGAR
jgi:hypothetical protein